jgi:hypothetical protein
MVKRSALCGVTGHAGDEAGFARMAATTSGLVAFWAVASLMAETRHGLPNRTSNRNMEWAVFNGL